MRKRLIQLDVEWCQSPWQRSPGCAFSVACLLYDTGPHAACTFVSPGPENAAASLLFTAYVIDPNLWYKKGELRKQLESFEFSSSFIITA